jgi:hypothetical protein
MAITRMLLEGLVDVLTHFDGRLESTDDNN